MKKIKEQKATAEQVAEALKQESAPLVGETLYSLEEVEASPSSFGVLPEILAGALRLINKEKVSRSEVLGAIENFKKRKV